MEKMSMESRREVVGRLRARYERAGRRYRRQLIDQLCELCGYERKYSIKVLGGKRPGPRGLPQGGARIRYTDEDRQVVRQIWRWGDYPCGKRLASMLPLWLSGYERRYGVLRPELRQKVLAISAATLDRLLAKDRARVPTRRGTTKPGRLLRSQIPVRCESWDTDRPGYLEADTVDHGGDSTAGSYMHSITYTDIYSGWVEQAAVWNKGAAGVLSRTRQIEADLPFVLLGFDSDNGSEFINHHLWKYFRGRKAPIAFTRSREYRKNDNAHVEEKNWTKVRQLLGYQRYDRPELVDIVQALYRNEWRLLQNFFIPVMKLQEKRRQGAKVHKKHDVPMTPAQRLLAWKALPADKREWLQRMQATLDPVTLTEAVGRQLKKLRALLRQSLQRHAA
jgi:hypothetical protein